MRTYNAVGSLLGDDTDWEELYPLSGHRVVMNQETGEYEVRLDPSKRSLELPKDMPEDKKRAILLRRQMMMRDATARPGHFLGMAVELAGLGGGIASDLYMQLYDQPPGELLRRGMVAFMGGSIPAAVASDALGIGPMSQTEMDKLYKWVQKEGGAQEDWIKWQAWTRAIIGQGWRLEPFIERKVFTPGKATEKNPYPEPQGLNRAAAQKDLLKDPSSYFVNTDKLKGYLARVRSNLTKGAVKPIERRIEERKADKRKAIDAGDRDRAKERDETIRGLERKIEIMRGAVNAEIGRVERQAIEVFQARERFMDQIRRKGK
jgi:hypothetical protein